MGNHKLDELTEDILTHHGVKGMKWGVRNDDKSSSNNDSAGGGGGGEEEEDEESLLEEFGDKLDNIKDLLEKKLKDVNKSLKKAGYNALVKIFGKAENGVKAEVTVNGLNREQYNKRKSPGSDKKYPADKELARIKAMSPSEKSKMWKDLQKYRSKRPGWTRIW